MVIYPLEKAEPQNIEIAAIDKIIKSFLNFFSRVTENAAETEVNIIKTAAVNISSNIIVLIQSNPFIPKADNAEVRVNPFIKPSLKSVKNEKK